MIVSAANEHDVRLLLPLVLLEFPRVGGTPSRPQEKPPVVRADTDYPSRDLLAACGIERAIGVRRDRKASVYQSLILLASGLIANKQLKRKRF